MGALFGGLFKAATSALGNLFGTGAKALAGNAANSGIGSALSMTKGNGGGLINNMLGKQQMNLPYSPAANQPMMSPIGNGNTSADIPAMAGQQSQQDPLSMKSLLGAAAAHSVGSKGGPGRQRADAAGQINYDVMAGSQAQNPMSMLAALQAQAPRQQSGPRQAQIVDPWTQYFMQMMNRGGGNGGV